MALERKSPLPPGRYWVDVPPSDRSGFAAWLQANRGHVAVRSTSESGDSGWQWILFDVTAPAMAFWQGPGYPTIADPSITSESQVKQVPTIEGASPGDFAAKIVKGAAPWVLAAFLGVQVIKRMLR